MHRTREPASGKSRPDIALNRKPEPLFGKDFGFKYVDLGFGIPPCGIRQPGLAACVPEKGRAIPAVLGGNLRQEEPTVKPLNHI